ncbi:MAG: WD40 repeat domain-containing protein [Candidatus Lokiarchaeota archaeon]|nr:WD40 repeat domain-containing protein [Candidatus Lokiarchaeota archaeon]
MKVKELWKFKYNAPILGIEVADINGNGQIEIIAYTKSGILLFISLDGELLCKEIISKDSPLWHLKIYDIDDDGRNELILGGMDGIVRIFKCNLTYNLELLWTHKCNSSISGILIEDINNDNLNELIIFSLDKTLRVLNPSNRQLVWGQVFEDGVGDANVFLKDKNSDKKEILACGNDGTIRIFDGTDGKLLWFKRFPNKLRCLTLLNSINSPLILCGGDDRNLHCLEKKTQNEINTIEFDDIVWKCLSYPYPILNKAIISSYSFNYFNNPIATEKINFSSKIICLNELLEVSWEIVGINLESLKVVENSNEFFVIVGFTKGEILIIEEHTGNILYEKNHESCTNMIQILKKKGFLFSCHDNGKIYAHKMKEISFF